MTQSNRADLFAALATLAQRYPNWRVGQMIANVSGWADADVWDVEDEQLLTAALEHLATEPGVANERAARGSREAFDRVLNKVPAAPPVPGDER
jgi:hypothetical protein